MAGSMKEIKLRIRSVESTMQITKAMELVASSKLRRAKERVEGSRPYFETLYTYLDENVTAAGVMETIRTTGDLKPETEEQLKAVLADFTASFIKNK